MASSTFNLSTHMRGTLEAWETDVDRRNNRSTVHARIWVWRDNDWSGQTYSSNVTKIININGTQVYYAQTAIEHYKSWGWINVAEASLVVGHDKYGKKNVTVSCSLDDIYGSNFDGSTFLSMDLSNINRAATINSFTGSDINKPFQATYTKESDGLSYKLRISIPGVRAIERFDNYVSGSSVSLSKASVDYLKAYTRNKTIVLGGVIEAYSGADKVADSGEINITCNIRREMYINIGGTFKRATAYIRSGGQWKEARPYLRINNDWKEGI